MKLPTLRPALSSNRPAVSMPRQQAERQRNAERSAEHEWRGWYKLKRWQDLRAEVLRRDGYQCRQTGVLLVGKAPAPDSAVVDHIRPHRGDPDLFWDIDNLQAVSKAWHDSDKQRIERGGAPMRKVGLDGYPV